MAEGNLTVAQRLKLLDESHIRMPGLRKPNTGQSKPPASEESKLNTSSESSDSEPRNAIKLGEPLPKPVAQTTPSPFGPPPRATLEGVLSDKPRARPPPTLPKPELPSKNGRMAVEIPAKAESEKLNDVRSFDSIPATNTEASLATSSQAVDQDPDDSQAPRKEPRGLSDPFPMKKLPVPLPNDSRRPYSDVTSESILASLHAMLPEGCTFLEGDNLIQGYRRRDARTITFPRIKPAMPTMTTNEINILERYAKT